MALAPDSPRFAEVARQHAFRQVQALDRSKAQDAQQKAQVIPDGITGALHALAPAGLVLDSDNKIVRATRSAFALGLVRDQYLVHPKL